MMRGLSFQREHTLNDSSAQIFGTRIVLIIALPLSA